MNISDGTFATPDGYAHHTRAWLVASPRALVVLQHGLGEHVGRYEHVAAALTDRGFSVYAMDARGHGKSAPRNDFGYFENLDQLVEDLRAFIASLPEKPFLIGHSMGGLISLLYGERYQSTIRGLVLSAAAVDAGDSIPLLVQKIVGFLGRVAPKMTTVMLDVNGLSKDKQVVSAYVADPLVWHGKIPARVGSELIRGGNDGKANVGKLMLPVLFLHGSKDPIVSPAGTPRLHEGAHSADKTLKIYDGLLHEIFNEPEQKVVLKDVTDWLEAHL